MKKTLNWLINIILLWLLLVVVATFLLPRVSNWRFDSVLSGSMEPALNVGGVVIIKPVEETDITTGDIVAYRSGESIITHRVMNVVEGQDQPSFITKGDANEDFDVAPVSASSVIGKVVFDIPYLGYLSSFIKSKLGFILAIYVPAVIIIILELINIWKVIAARRSEV